MPTQQVYLTEDQYANMALIARQLGIAVKDAVKMAITEFIDRRLGEYSCEGDEEGVE